MKKPYFHLVFWLILSLFHVPTQAQVLVDSIPYPGVSGNLWGIHVGADTIFLGADGPGDIRFSDHSGNIIGQLATGLTFNHGLVRKPGSYLIAKDYTTSGALLYEIDLAGAPLGNWTFPDVIGGPSSGIGDIFPDGNAVWYTMYFPDFSTFPFAYAYKWMPGDPTAMDTVPLHGEQPYGIALKGDTLFYVTDNLNGDQERIYAYDLTNEQDIGWVELPDTPIDNDMSPRGMYYDGEFLYLIANRQGNNMFAYQTVYIYAFDINVGLNTMDPGSSDVSIHPNPADARVRIEFPFGPRKTMRTIEIHDALGKHMWSNTSTANVMDVDVSQWTAGAYLLNATSNGNRSARTFVVRH